MKSTCFHNKNYNIDYFIIFRCLLVLYKRKKGYGFGWVAECGGYGGGEMIITLY